MTNQTKSPLLSSDLSSSPLSEKELNFLQMRRRFLKPSKIIGCSLFFFLAALFLWMFFKVPNMINPLEVERQIASNTLSMQAIKLMAILFPLMVVLAFFLAASIILFGFWAFANERTYLKIIETLLTGSQGRENQATPAAKSQKETKKKQSGKK